MKKTISYAISAVLAASLLPQAASAMSLEEALVATYTGNPELLAARAGQRATDEKVPQALSGWRPTVNMNSSYGTQTIEQNTSASTAREIGTRPKTMTFTVTQPIFNGFRTVNATSAAENTVKASRGSLIATEQTILLSAAQAYMDVLRDMAVLELRVNNEQVLRRQLDATRDRFEVGEITRTDVSQAEARHAGAVAARAAAESTLMSTRATFAKVVGVPAENLDWPAEVKTLPATLDDTISLAETQQPSLVAAEYSAKAAVDTVRQVRGELLPSVSLEASNSRNWETSDHDSFRNVKSVVATVNVPLYESGSVYSRIREAKNTAGQRRLQVDQALLSARAQAVQSWESLQSARAQIQSLVSQVDSSRVALEGVEKEAQVGSRTVLDVLDAEQELLDAQVNLVTAKRNERVASYQLMASVGTLTAENLALPVDAHKPADHYDDVRDQWIGGNSQADSDYDMATDEARSRAVREPTGR